MLYTKESILGLGRIFMTEDRKEVRAELIDSDDLGSIRCLQKKQLPITITQFEEFLQILEKSGIKYKDPGFVAKKIGQPNTP
jgi:hypothetical protein